jgi:hypothetical protein
MSVTISTVRLHLNQRQTSFLVPLYIAATVAVVSILISLIYWRAGSEPGTEGWIAGSQANPGIIYGLAGFLIYLGVASVSTTFPFALTLGATRRTFVAGTLLWNASMAVYLAVVFAILLALELATDHWFVGFYIFDIHALGAGDFGRLFATVTLGVLTALTLGGVFGASWVRFGARGPQFIAMGIVLVLALLLIVFVPQAEQILAAFQLWWLAVVAGVVIAVSATGTWLLLRPASVR